MTAVSSILAPVCVAEDCFHCGLPLAGARFEVSIDGRVETTCCRGCQAVAEAIAGHNLTAYYRHRTATAERAEALSDGPSRLALYDLPEVQRTFVRQSDPHEQEATLLLEGITCAACAWLIEERVRALEGVRSVEVSHAARRARVRWDTRNTQLSAVLRAIIDFGYRPHPYDGARSNTALRAERRTMLWRLFVAGFGMMQVMMYAIPAYVSDSPIEREFDGVLQLASLILTLPVMLWSAAPFYAGAWRTLRQGRVGMDVPVALGIVIAFAASAHAAASGHGAVYFDSITMFVFLLLGARYLEMVARAKAVQAQERLTKLVPAFAEKLDRHPNPLQRSEVPVALLAPGDHIALRPGAAIPADGTVVEGESTADEALLTGESRPVAKRAGDPLIGGSLNLHGPLVMRVERIGQETVLAGIVRLLDRAHRDKPTIAIAADRVAGVFVAALLVLAALTGFVWYAIEPERALWVAVALLVVSCPCALSLATPAALSAASSALHRLGVLVTRGHALETLGAATHFVFDKTGTLTEGRLSLIGVIPLGREARDRCLGWAASLEMHSEHPIGRAIVAAAQPGEEASEVRNVPGKGVEANVAGMRMRIGSPGFVAELSASAPPDELNLVSDEVTTVALGDERGLLALLTFGDTLRAHARATVQTLRAMGKTVCLLSGDRQASVDYVARQLGIEVAHGEASPDAKVAFVRALQADGAVVAMIGDGVNDAPVLAGAQVSLALATGTQLAQASADMVLMSGRLDAVVTALRLAQRTRTIIRENLGAALVYNLLALPLAALGHVTPVLAALGMSLSSLTVVGNALRLLRLPPEAGRTRVQSPARPYGDGVAKVGRA